MLKGQLIIGCVCALMGLSFGAWRGRTATLSADATSAPMSEAGDSYIARVHAHMLKHVQARYRFKVEGPKLRVIMLPEGSLEVGRTALIFFSAQRPEAPHEREDLYMMQAQMGANAHPITFTPPRNLTENPKSFDRLFETSTQGARILYGQLNSEGACRAVTQLSWDPRDLAQVSDTNLITKLKQASYYDRWEAPKWLTLRFRDPLTRCSARFSSDQNSFIVLSDGVPFFTLDLATGQVSPSGLGVEVVRVPEPRPQLLEGAQSLLSDYGLINQEDGLALTAAYAKLVNTLDRNLYEILVDQSDPTQHQPIGQLSSMTDGRRPHWYPAKIDVRGGLRGEGVWRPVTVGEDRSPLVLKTFIRLDAEHPYRNIQLFAFDMRRLGLHFVGGADPSQRILEGVGSGHIPAHHRSSLIAAFNGGPKPLMGQGIQQDGHQLMAPSQGLSTIATDQRGRALFGRLDSSKLPAIWQSLRQSFAPLVDQRVLSQDVLPPQSPYGRLDHIRLPRSALGITHRGTLIYAWAEAATAQHMATALKRVGVTFGLTLKTGAAQMGLAIYPEGSHAETRRASTERPRVASSKMQLSPEAWLKGSDLDFFYLVRAQSLPSEVPQRGGAWQDKEGVWTQIPHQDVDPLIATSFLTQERVGDEVKLTRVDGERLQLNLALGKTREGGDQERSLPTAPTARIPVGLVHPELGYKVLGRLISPPVDGRLTWGVSAQGRSKVGVWGEGELKDSDEWMDLLQGQALIRAGKPSSALPADVAGPALALGVAPEGDLLLAVSDRGSSEALRRALMIAGAHEAMLVTYQSSADIGTLQTFYEYQGRTFYTLPPQRALRPALLGSSLSVLLGPSDAFIFTQKSTQNRARFISSFKELNQKLDLK